MSATESAIVGSLLEINGHEPPKYLAKLLAHAPDSFDDNRYGQIATIIRQLRADGRPVHAISVTEACSLPEAVFLVSQIASSALPIEMAEVEAKTLWESYRQRQMKTVFSEAASAMEASPTKANAIAKGVRNALDALDHESSLGLSIRQPDEILAMPLDDHDCILGDRLLAKGQSLTILGPGGIGKSRLLLQFAVTSIAGLPFIGIETHCRGLRWLLFQVENGIRRVQSDLIHLRNLAVDDWALVNDCLYIHTLETDKDGWLSLESEDNQRRIRAAIQRINPMIICFDPLNQIAIGDPNKDADMALTCQTLTRLCREGNPHRAIVILHHTLTGRSGAVKSFGIERAGYGRNSKVLQAWTRGQINLAPISQDSNDIIAVLCGKCSNGKEFAPFAVSLNTSTMIYEVHDSLDLESWQEDLSGKSEPLMTPDRVKELCFPPKTKAELAHAILDDCGCARQVAYKYIKRAETKRTITFDETTKKYSSR